MSLGDKLSQLEQFNELKELSPSGDPVEGVYIAMEAQMMNWLQGIAVEIEQRQREEWRSREEARELIASLDTDQRREQFINARQNVLDDLARIPTRYNDMAVRGEVAQPTPIIEALRDVLVTMHNPTVQESLIAAADEDIQPEVRLLFQQLGVLLWGFSEVMWGNRGDYFEDYVDYLARFWGLDREEIVDRLGFDHPEGEPD